MEAKIHKKAFLTYISCYDRESWRVSQLSLSASACYLLKLRKAGHSFFIKETITMWMFRSYQQRNETGIQYAVCFFRYSANRSYKMVMQRQRSCGGFRSGEPKLCPELTNTSHRTTTRCQLTVGAIAEQVCSALRYDKKSTWCIACISFSSFSFRMINSVFFTVRFEVFPGLQCLRRHPYVDRSFCSEWASDDHC